jgi:hypothetical protein
MHAWQAEVFVMRDSRQTASSVYRNDVKEPKTVEVELHQVDKPFADPKRRPRMPRVRDGLYNQRALYIRGGFGPVVLHAALPVCSEKIEAETVLLGFVDAEQIRAEMDPLIRLDQTFENRVLHTLSVIQANLGHAAQATWTIGTACSDIIADDDHHDSPPLKGRIGIEVAA